MGKAVQFPKPLSNYHVMLMDENVNQLRKAVQFSKMSRYLLNIAGGTGTAGTAMAVPVSEGGKMALRVDFHRSFTQTSKVVTIR